MCYTDKKYVREVLFTVFTLLFYSDSNDKLIKTK